MTESPTTALSGRIEEYLKTLGDSLLKLTKTGDDVLYPYQRTVVDYLTNKITGRDGESHYPRGLCALFEAGLGKTRVSAAMAEVREETFVIFFSPKAVHEPFREACAGYYASIGKPDPFLDETTASKFIFVTSNDGRGARRKMAEARELVAARRRARGWTSQPAILCIMDEAHKFAQTVSHQMTYTLFTKETDLRSVNLFNTYKDLMAATDMQFLIMTGTPITGDPFSIVPIFNLARGYMRNEFGDRFTTLPEDYIEFCKYFIDPVSKTVLNRRKFQERIYGLTISYRAPIADRSAIPPIKKQAIRRLVMHGWQKKWYDMCKMREEQYELERSKKSSEVRSRGIPHYISAVLSKGGLYRVMTKQASNFAFPERLQAKPTLRHDRELIGDDTESDERKELLMSQVVPEDLSDDNLLEYSCKFARILRTVTQPIVEKTSTLETHFPQAFFSSFVKGEGIGLFAKCLDARGYYSINEIIKTVQAMPHEATPGVASLVGKAKRKLDVMRETARVLTFLERDKEKYWGKLYAKYTGDEERDVLHLVLSIFNLPENSEGHLIKVLMISPAGAYAHTFRSVSCLHICDCPWNESDTEQLIKRFVRIDSHSYLDVERRGIEIYYYFAIPDRDSTTLGTDEFIYENGKMADIMNKQVMNTIEKTGLLCPAIEKTRGLVSPCFQCIPSIFKIFNENFLYHMSDTPTCIQPIALINVKKIERDGQIYYISTDNGKIYRYSVELADYIVDETIDEEMLRNDFTTRGPKVPSS
jgi:hypothetical protein